MAEMKGLELCRKYFDGPGMDMLKQRFPSRLDRIAAGLVGHGSDCFGFDDDISRDHDWGPGFCMWLTDRDFEGFGPALQAAYDELPASFMGHKRYDVQTGQSRTGVFKISEFYHGFTGLTGAPASNAQWIRLSDEYLSACTNGDVFFDPLGRFSQIRLAIQEFYPEPVWLFKFAARCLKAAQSGQYNYYRSLKRSEFFAAACAENRFCLDIIAIVFLLERKFMPFYKWCHRAVAQLGDLGRFVADHINALTRQKDPQKKADIIETLSARLIQELVDRNLSDSAGDFLLDHGMSIQSRIKDPVLKAMDPWAGF